MGQTEVGLRQYSSHGGVADSCKQDQLVAMDGD